MVLLFYLLLFYHISLDKEVYHMVQILHKEVSPKVLRIQILQKVLQILRKEASLVVFPTYQMDKVFFPTFRMVHAFFPTFPMGKAA